MTELRFCAIVPTYDNPGTVGQVVRAIRAHVPDVIVVDDGSGAAGREAVDALAREGLARVLRLASNRGKGVAVRAGFERARALGFTHAVQVDADGQHEAADLPRMMAASRAHPAALVLGDPVFDASAPTARRLGRKLSVFWCHVECGSEAIADPLCGFRVYPLEASLRAGRSGDRMDFDPEIAVRLVWAGTEVVNLPTRVRYFSRAQGGVSHFRLFRDNVRISWMHTRLMVERTLRGAGRRP